MSPIASLLAFAFYPLLVSIVALRVRYAFATPAALMSTLITVVDVANPINVAKSPDAKSDSRHTLPAVVDA